MYGVEQNNVEEEISSGLLYLGLYLTVGGLVTVTNHFIHMLVSIH